MCFETRNRRYRLLSSRRAFSLMELMVVLLIIGLLTAAVTVGVRGARENGRRTTANLEISNIVNGLEMYNSVTASYPNQSEGLEVLLEPLTDYPSGILKKKGELKDPWGMPYLYVITNNGREPFEVLSTGPDKREGTDDDLSSLAEADE